MRDLTFEHLHAVNTERSRRWHDGNDSWTGADWSNAMGGECGEAQNVVKKLRRIETGLRGTQDPSYEVLLHKLGHELADTLLYLDLLADHYGIDLSDAVEEKFNLVSAREGFPERL